MRANRGNVISELLKNKTLYAMLLPSILFYFVLAYLPMAGMVVAFKEFRYDTGLFMSPWTGFDNFEFFFISGKAWLITKNTLLYNTAFIITGLFLQLLVAIIIAELGGVWAKKIIQSTLLFPFFISWVIVGIIAYNLLNYEYGFINSLLKMVGKEPLDFYGEGSYWKYIIVAFNNWKSVGFGSLIYLAVIMGIDPSLNEAAKIDGATIFQRIRHITIPLTVPTTVILVLLAVGNIFRGNFDLFYQLVGNNGALFDATDVIDTYVFRSLINSSDIGMSAAAGFFQSVLCFAIILITNYVVKRVNSDYSLF